MVMWTGQFSPDWKIKHHEPEWISWYDFQSECTWFACKKCEGKFFFTDEFLYDTSSTDFESLANKEHTEHIQRNIDA